MRVDETARARSRTESRPHAVVAAIALVNMAASAVSACASLSGYDPSRYAHIENENASAPTDPETTPIPRGRPIMMLDPRSPLDAATATDARAASPGERPQSGGPRAGVSEGPPD